MEMIVVLAKKAMFVRDLKTLSQMEKIIGRDIDTATHQSYFIQWASLKGYQYYAPFFVILTKDKNVYKSDLKDGVYKKEEIMLVEHHKLITSFSY